MIYVIAAAAAIVIIGIVILAVVALRRRRVDEWCCDLMADQMTSTCEHHGENRWECPDFVVLFHPDSGVYMLPIRDGGSSGIIITYCPWCGSQLWDPPTDTAFDLKE